MRLIFATFLLFGFSATAISQACGYTFLTIYLKDSSGTAITKAEIQTFSSDFGERDMLHYPVEDESDDRLRKKIRWSEKKQAFFGSEGMCSGHRDVGLRVTAKGFETFNTVIDLPLGWISYSITLRRLGSVEVAKATELANVRGLLKDKNEALIRDASIVVTDGSRKVVQTSSDDGSFEFDLPVGHYSVIFYKQGFRRLILTNFEVAKREWDFLDLKLKVRGCDDCKGDLYGENDGAERADEYIDYRTIKKKKDN
jgi:hypothetical protein